MPVFVLAISVGLLPQGLGVDEARLGVAVALFSGASGASGRERAIGYARDVSAVPYVPPSFDDFERLVDVHVTPHMVNLGYARIGAYHGESSGGYLVARERGLRQWTRRLIGQALSRPGPVEFSMGYEALSDEAAARVLPDDPGTAQEAWLCLDRSSGGLEFFLREGLQELAERYGTQAERNVIVTDSQPLSERLRVLDGLLARFVAATG
jgi:hypothetical protein